MKDRAPTYDEVMASAARARSELRAAEASHGVVWVRPVNDRDKPCVCYVCNGLGVSTTGAYVLLVKQRFVDSYRYSCEAHLEACSVAMVVEEGDR